MLQIATRNNNPNFTIILPGPCQAKCSFCFWKQDKNNSNFIKGLKTSLEELPNLFNQISISGGEPTISPYFKETLEIINEYKKNGKIQKVVLTTNGLNLKNLDLTGINHINISRHAITYEENQKIFETKNIPNNEDLKEIANHCNTFGIDVNFNVVFVDEINTNYNIEEWTNLAKNSNVSSLTFRNQYNNYGISKLENDLIENNYKPHIISSCPVCRTSTFFVNGVKVRFHSSDYEPTESDKFQEDEVYEVILQQNGNLTRDWEEKKILINSNKENKMEMPGVENLEYSKQEIKQEYKNIKEKIESNNTTLKDAITKHKINPNGVHAAKLMNITLYKNLSIITNGFEKIPLDSKKGEKLLKLMKELEDTIEKNNSVAFPNSLSETKKTDGYLSCGSTRPGFYDKPQKVTPNHKTEEVYNSCGNHTYSSCGDNNRYKQEKESWYDSCGGNTYNPCD